MTTTPASPSSADLDVADLRRRIEQRAAAMTERERWLGTTALALFSRDLLAQGQLDLVPAAKIAALTGELLQALANTSKED